MAKAAALAKKEAAGDFSHLKNKKGEFIAKPLPQPTLPNLSVDDDDDTTSIRTRTAAPAPSTYAATDYYSDYKVAMDYPADYPPMPAYAGGYHQYNNSLGTLPDQPQQMYDEDHASQVHLASAGAPYGHSEGYAYDQYDQYRSASTAPDFRSQSTAPDYRSQSTAPDWRSQQTTLPDYRSQSTAPDYRSQSTAPDYRSMSTAPDYRSASTAPYGHQAQGMYQDEYHPNPYSPGAQPMLNHTDQYGYSQGHTGGNDGYDYNGGHTHAM